MRTTNLRPLRFLGIAIAALVFTIAGGAEAHATPWYQFWNLGGGSHHRHHGAAPEIDPGTAGSAVTLLAGGLAVLRDRRRR